MAADAGKPWRRASAGSYRSSDERFEIQSEGSGRWFLVDEQEHDELGLPRTLGPFATLEAAKEAAEAQRGRAAEASPLAERLAEAAANLRPTAAPPTARGRGTAGSSNGSAPTRVPAGPTPKPSPTTTSAKPGLTAPPRASTAGAGTRRRDRVVRPATKPPKPKSWLELLADRDAAAARRARTMITALVVEGVGPAAADEAVRRELVDGEPAIAEARLDRAVAAAIAEVADPRSLRRIARGLPADAEPAAAGADLARTVADDLVDRLAVILEAGGGHHAVLPGWALVERPPGRRAPRRGADEADAGREIRLRGDADGATTRRSEGRGGSRE